VRSCASRAAASFPPPSVYFWQDGRQQTLADALGGNIAFALNDEVWVYAWELLAYNDELLSGLQHYQDVIWTEIPIPPHLFNPDTMMAVDGNDRLWLTDPDGKSLYYYDGQP
jgi:hypothetical protein